jgi:hypothetical protein
MGGSELVEYLYNHMWADLSIRWRSCLQSKLSQLVGQFVKGPPHMSFQRMVIGWSPVAMLPRNRSPPPPI